MANEVVVVPQMGEGLQEVRFLSPYRKVGERVERDEPLYSMETDKAVMDIESPCTGVVKAWLAHEGEVLPIGAPVVELVLEGIDSSSGLLSDSAVASQTTSSAVEQVHAEQTSRDLRFTQDGAPIPPATRAYCLNKGLSPEVIFTMRASGARLMPADVDSYLSNNAAIASPVAAPVGSGAGWVDRPLSEQQRVLVSRMRRSAELVVPATITRPILWGAVVDCTTAQRELEPAFRPSEFQTFSWAVACASRDHPATRATMLGDDTLRQRDHLNLGIAVSLDSSDIVTAVVQVQNTPTYHSFIEAMQTAITEARTGVDQATADVTLYLTYMGAYGITDAVPVLVAPASGVLFVGAPYKYDGQLMVNIALTFDHRVMNGVAAAKFLASVAANVEMIADLV